MECVSVHFAELSGRTHHKRPFWITSLSLRLEHSCMRIVFPPCLVPAVLGRMSLQPPHCFYGNDDELKGPMWAAPYL